MAFADSNGNNNNNGNLFFGIDDVFLTQLLAARTLLTIHQFYVSRRTHIDVCVCVFLPNALYSIFQVYLSSSRNIYFVYSSNALKFVYISRIKNSFKAMLPLLLALLLACLVCLSFFFLLSFHITRH